MRTILVFVILAAASLCQAQNRIESTVTGSGFFVNTEGYLLTNLHVVTGCQTASIKVSGLATFARILFSDTKNDLAVLKFDHPPAFLVFRQDQRLRLGENVVAVGYPLAGVVASSMNLTTGSISALAGIGDDARMVQFSAPVQPGNSGGPLLDQSGHVVGIVTSKLSPLWTAAHLGDIPQNVNFAIKASVVRDFLDSKGIDYGTAPSTETVATPTIADQVRKAVVSIECAPGLSGGFAAKNEPNTSSETFARRTIQRISDIKTIAIASLGNSDAAALVREKLSNRLVKSGRVVIVEDPERADAVLTGVVGANVYGRADTGAFKLVTWDGRIIWVGEKSTRGFGSASGHMADKVSDELLKAIDRDTKTK
jgi:hypothetical protein